MNGVPEPWTGLLAAAAGGAASGVMAGVLTPGGDDWRTTFVTALPWSLLTCAVAWYAYREYRLAKTTAPSRLLGIVGSTGPTVRDSIGEPRRCMKEVRHDLVFMGTLASKWVVDGEVRRELDELLTRLDGAEGSARFLIVDPISAAFKRLVCLRNGHISVDSLAHLAALARAHPSLEVKCYAHLPIFRMVGIDNRRLALSPYVLDGARYARTHEGWDVPCLELDLAPAFPLADAVLALFEATWEDAGWLPECTPTETGVR